MNFNKVEWSFLISFFLVSWLKDIFSYIWEVLYIFIPNVTISQEIAISVYHDEQYFLFFVNHDSYFIFRDFEILYICTRLIMTLSSVKTCFPPVLYLVVFVCNKFDYQCTTVFMACILFDRVYFMMKAQWMLVKCKIQFVSSPVVITLCLFKLFHFSQTNEKYQPNLAHSIIRWTPVQFIQSKVTQS